MPSCPTDDCDIRLEPPDQAEGRHEVTLRYAGEEPPRIVTDQDD